MVQQVKDLILSLQWLLLWRGFNPSPRKFHTPQMWQEKKKNFSINVQMWNFFRMQGIKLNFKYLNKENALFDRTRDDGLVLGLINNLEKKSDKFSDSAT